MIFRGASTITGGDAVADPQARSDVPTFAVIPTFGRPCFEESAKSVVPQVDRTFVIETAPFEWVPGSLVSKITDHSRPKNISRWWNLGIKAAQQRAHDLGASAWNVLIMNDDVIACPHLVRTLTQALRLGWINGESDQRLLGALPVLAYPDNFAGDRFALNLAPGPIDLTTRISGWCFMIKGESGLRADERLVWFFGDDMLDWQAREMGGALMVPGCAVQHLHPNEATAADPELTAQTHRDRVMFGQIWGGRFPH